MKYKNRNELIRRKRTSGYEQRKEAYGSGERRNLLDNLQGYYGKKRTDKIKPERGEKNIGRHGVVGNVILLRKK